MVSMKRRIKECKRDDHRSQAIEEPRLTKRLTGKIRWMIEVPSSLLVANPMKKSETQPYKDITITTLKNYCTILTEAKK